MAKKMIRVKCSCCKRSNPPKQSFMGLDEKKPKYNCFLCHDAGLTIIKSYLSGKIKKMEDLHKIMKRYEEAHEAYDWFIDKIEKEK